MSTLNKILLGIVIIAILLVSGEVVYYFYTQKQKTTTSYVVPTLIPVSPIPTRTTVGSKLVPSPIKKSLIATSSAINKNVLARLGKLKKGVPRTAVLNLLYRGQITKIVPDNSLSSGPKHRFGLEIKGSKDLTNTFFYNDDSKSVLRIYNGVGKKVTQQEIKFTDLKIGDIIVITEQINLFKKPALGFMAVKIMVDSPGNKK